MVGGLYGVEQVEEGEKDRKIFDFDCDDFGVALRERALPPSWTAEFERRFADAPTMLAALLCAIVFSIPCSRRTKT